jgi:hypothetical protein
MVAMGVLKPTGDRLAVRRTAQFFLNSFQVRPGWAERVCAHRAGSPACVNGSLHPPSVLP